MAENNKLELVVEADVNKTTSIKSINTGLSSMQQAAGKAARGVSSGIDELTVSVVKGFGGRQPPRGLGQEGPDWTEEWIRPVSPRGSVARGRFDSTPAGRV